MAQAIAYLGFNGNCAEAMKYYERVLGLGAKLEVMLSGAQSPMAAKIPKEIAHRILHARLVFGDGSQLYAGDAPTHVPYGGMHGISVTLNYSTLGEAERVFAALAEGGTVTMQLQPVFWAEGCGMLTDRFGTPWIINAGLRDPSAQ